jgi:hypothetical protein
MANKNGLEFEFDFDEGNTYPCRCYDPKLNYLCFSGYGETKTEARADYFKNQPKFINQAGINILDVTV